MNILTYDIEEWALVKDKGSVAEKKCAGYDKYLKRILELLEACGVKATFFCTGMMAKKYPEVLKLIFDRGHEIGCHSLRHTWMNKMSVTEAREDTHAAVDAIEQCVGHKVLSYRAPAFSIGENNKWMFDVLCENGIERDSSIFPVARDFGGFPGFSHKEPCIIDYNGLNIKEFPICTTRLFGKEVAYSGGGYFRFFPLWFSKSQLKKSTYSMCYFHIGDLIPENHGVLSKTEYEAYFKEPGTLKARYIRHIKSNLGKKGAWNKMEQLISSNHFLNIQDFDEKISWNTVPTLKL